MQCVGYMVLAVYLDKVLPDRMGVRLPFWYPLLPFYWKPTKVITFPTLLVKVLFHKCCRLHSSFCPGAFFKVVIV